MVATLRNVSTPGGYPTYTYDVLYYTDTISTTVTADPAVVTQWITEVKFIHSGSDQANLVGFDTKWRFPYGPGPNRTATVHLCIGNRCLIYQIFHTPYTPRALLEFFSDPKYAFAGVRIESTMNRLFNDYEISPLYSRTVMADLGRWAAQRYGQEVFASAGVPVLAGVVLAKVVDSPLIVIDSAWNDWLLTPEQVDLACVDAFVSLQIAKVFANLQ